MGLFDDRPNDADAKAADKDVDDAEVEKIKVGEEEFSADELQDLVGIGKIGKEAEEKFNTKIDKIWPEYTKKSQKLKDFEEQNEELSKYKEDQESAVEEQANKKAAAGEDLSPEELRKLASKAGYVTQDNFSEMYKMQRAGEKLSDQCDDLNEKGNPYEAEALPKFEKNDMLEWMVENKLDDPIKAYKIRYEDEIDTWKADELGKTRSTKPYSDMTSKSGNKEPKPVKVTKDNIHDHVEAALRGEI